MTTLAVTSLIAVPLAAQADGSASGAAGVSASSTVSSAADVQEPRVSAPETCRFAREAVVFYRHSTWERQRARGGRLATRTPIVAGKSCHWVRYAARTWSARATAARLALERWTAYHYDWRSWLPDKWARIGACETGYGRRPGDWRWNSGTYEGAFGFFHGSWDAFVGVADRKAGPYPHAAYLATPRQQYEVALAIWRRYGFSGWGCRGA